MRALVLVAWGLFIAAGCGGPGVDDRLDELRGDNAPAEYYLGKTFAGLPLTAIHRENRWDTFVYGDCEAHSDEGCATPLQLQNVKCPGKPTAVAIFADGSLARRARLALVPLNARARRASPPKTAIGVNPFAACFPPRG